jgi:hypothetical protein
MYNNKWTDCQEKNARPRKNLWCSRELTLQSEPMLSRKCLILNRLGSRLKQFLRLGVPETGFCGIPYPPHTPSIFFVGAYVRVPQHISKVVTDFPRGGEYGGGGHKLGGDPKGTPGVR